MNNKYNNFMEKIDISEEFKKQLIDKINKEEIKKESLKFKIQKKIISIISALTILSAGGTVFAVTMPEEWKNSIKEFFGIISNEQYEEIKTDVNISSESNGYNLTLENYGIDSESLLIVYDLKTAKEIELLNVHIEEPNNYFYDRVKIIDKNSNEILIDTNKGMDELNADEYEEIKSTILVNRINNLEYKIYEIYSIDSNKISDNCFLDIDFNLMELPEDSIGLSYDTLGKFKFKLQIEKEKINTYYEEFDIKNKTIALKQESIVDGNKIPEKDAILNITKIKNTDLTTKICIDWDMNSNWHSNTDYTIKITDENNNIILDRNIEFLVTRK